MSSSNRPHQPSMIFALLKIGGSCHRLGLGQKPRA
jgi:hypothetical protein